MTKRRREVQRKTEERKSERASAALAGERANERGSERKRNRKREGERERKRERRHRTSIVDIDIIIVHRKAGRVGSCATVGSIERECVLSTGSRAARVRLHVRRARW